ncbi:MAG: GDP-L-fucose synthase [Helicobacter sp.]|nr:GDP-L-fucose synthase [Helicobacter sp.]
MHKDSKIYIAGHKGLIGSSILKALKAKGYNNFVLKTHQELDLTRQKEVEEFFEQERPEYVFFCAAKVGGMIAQIQQKANFLYENLMMQNNVIHNAYKNQCKKLLYLSSLCIYPEHAPLPIKEEYMLQGSLQSNNEAYGIAKIAGIKLCEFYSLQYGVDYLSLAPASVYGTEDNYDLSTANVLAAIFRKILLAKLFHERQYDLLLKDTRLEDMASVEEYLKGYNIDDRRVVLLGTGNSSREFLHTDDLADASIFFMENTSIADCVEMVNGRACNSHINLGSEELISIRDLAFLIKEVLGYKGEVEFENKSENDGTMKKIADCSKARSLGWNGIKIGIKEGLEQMYQTYLKNLQMV